jgi:hypothetical protein
MKIVFFTIFSLERREGCPLLFFALHPSPPLPNHANKKRQLPTDLGQLPDHAVALVADQRLDLGDREDRVCAGADLDAGSRIGQEPQPPVSGEALGDDDALGAGLVVDLKVCVGLGEGGGGRGRGRK